MRAARIYLRRRVRTFSIGFTETDYNEAPHAAKVARHLGTDHTELYVTAAEAQAVVPKLAQMFDEPFADSSQVPTFLVSALARQHVTVSLSGDGGDELFAGYPRYSLAKKIWRNTGRIPSFAKKAAASGVRAVSANRWNALFQAAAPILPGRWKQRRPGEQMHRFANTLLAPSVEELYRGIVSHWDPERLVLGTIEPPTALTDPARQAELSDLTYRMMYLDLISYLPDDILTKVDRASMAVSMEARVPLLDHRVVEFAWRLPMSMKVRNGQEKWILRQVLYKYVPRDFVERPKMGFGIPVGEWLSGPLRDWAEDLLNARLLEDQGLLDSDTVRGAWREHLEGRRNWQYHLWDVLMLQAWLAEQKKDLPVFDALPA